MKNGTCWRVAALAALLVGCEDDPFQVRWEANPRESVVYSLDVEELGVPTAFDLSGRRPVQIEDPALEGGWDFAVGREGDGLVFLPARALGVSSDAAVVWYPDTDYDDVTSAPDDSTRYVTNEPVPVELGSVYVIRSHEQLETGGFRRSCNFYGKLEPLEINLEVGWVRFVQDASPDCNNRSLVPTED